MKTLILSTVANVHANRVEKEVIALGGEIIRINFDNLFRQAPMLLQDGLCVIGRKEEEIRSVFIHHPSIKIDESLGFDVLDIQLVKSQWLSWLSDAPALLNDTVKWVNHPSMMKVSSSVVYQLKVAAKCGFRTPKSCQTTDFEALRQFASKNGKIILKPGNLPNFKAQGNRILAQLVSVENLSQEQLMHAPHFFQEYIEKQYELRVHVIGQTVIACKIESQANPDTKIDWRNYNLKDTPHSEFHLPAEIADRCIEVTRALGYTLGIMDIIMTPDNEFVFLECNSQGHWLWIEELTNLPITQAIAHLLM